VEKSITEQCIPVAMSHLS